MEKKLTIKLHRQGFKEPIWGLFPNEDTIIKQYPAPTIEKAVSFFLEVKDEFLEQGYTHFILPTGEEISLKADKEMEKETCMDILKRMKNHIKSELNDILGLLDYKQNENDRLRESMKIFINLSHNLRKLADYIDSREPEYTKLEGIETSKE